MPTQSSKPSPETEAVRGIYAAINRNDVPGALSFMDPAIVRIEPPDFPTPGTYRGHAEMAAHIANGRSTWAEGGCAPEAFFTAGDKVVALLHIRVRLKDRTDWIDGYIADGFTFRNGKATEMHSFTKKEEALAWAGIAD
jgi:ketosteroid isomerase-like protein